MSMFDNINFTAFAAEPPKPARSARDPTATDHVWSPDVVYALHGPDGWYGAHVTKEPFPGVFTLTIRTIRADSFPVFEDAITWHRGHVAWRDGFYRSFYYLLGKVIHTLGWRASDWCVTEYPVPEDHWIDLCTDGKLREQMNHLVCL
jgi:hypothetical protein